jgi:alkylation response protein AidB-like acyl-CoA dehydrogenase
MNFDDTPQEAEFRATARAWIGANAPRQYEEELRKSSLGRTQLKNANILEVAKAWQKKKADAGWACLHWPKDYGGRGSSPIERVIWQAVRPAVPHVHHRPRHVRAYHDGVRARGA